MKVTIDNQDGNGPIDYSRALCADSSTKNAVEIHRRLNEPSAARLQVDCLSHGLAVPTANARIVITAKNGSFLFTGFLPSAAEPVFEGYNSSGQQHRFVLNALSEDWLLNREALPQAAPLLGQTAGGMIRTITNRVNPALVQMNGLEDVGTIGFFEPMPGKTWSENVAALANQARAAYRVLNGQLTLAPIGSTIHDVDDTVGHFEYATPSATGLKQIVNDVTITGLSQPMQYVTELFEGDGATVLFQLQRNPIREIRPILLNEEFTSPTLNMSIWQVNDAGGYINISGGGLTLTGGAGTDGTTTLTAIDPVELGGEVIIESGFVQLDNGSDGILCGLYSGAIKTENCIAGFRVKTSGPNTMFVPLVNGNEVGTTFTIQAGHRYILRMRVHSPELQRMLNSYFSYGSNGPAVYGGGVIGSPLHFLFEIQDMALLPYVNIGSTILYDGACLSSPAIASFACVNSMNLMGNIGYFKVTRPGTLRIVSTPANGEAFTRRIGLAVEGADCNVFRDGFLYFYKLATPQPGEILAVSYRVAAPSVARLSSPPTGQQGGTGEPAVSQWVGHAIRPAARSSVDCENACQAVLDFSANPSASWKGNYAYYNMQNRQDVWPGDVLSFQSPTTGEDIKAIVRGVTIQSTSSYPEVLNYKIQFANDWAEAVALKMTNTVAADVNLPREPQSSPGNYLENLNALQVVSITSSEIDINANATPPTNGGFEVRSRDYTFGADTQEDLVLRSPVANFTITRAADLQQFYIRMYDGSNPPVYSRLSSSIFTDIPIS